MVAVVVAGVYDDAANRLIADHLGLVAGAVLAGLLMVVALRAPLRRPGALDEGHCEDADPAVWGPEAIEPKAIAAGTHAADRPVAPAADRPDDSTGAASPDPAAPGPTMSPRALLLQVRTLEATLAEEDRRLEGVRRDSSRRAEEQIRAERERVQVTLRVLREAVAGQPGDVAAARIEVALERLGAGSGFARPLLATGASSAWAVTFAPPVPLAVPGGPVPGAVTVDEAAAPEHVGAAAPEDLPAADVDAAAGPTGGPPADAVPEAPAGPPRVLPVPPLTTSAAPARKGRRLRRSRAGV